VVGRHGSWFAAALAVLMAAVVASCGGGAATASPASTSPAAIGSSASPSASAAATAAATAAPSASPSAAPTTAATAAPTSPPAQATAKPTSGPAGPATLDAPDQVGAGAQFAVNWTGPAGAGDYVTIVASGATRWTTEPYFYTTVASPGKLVAATTAGSYELWYVQGSDDSILTRRPVTVTPFVGSLDAAAGVESGTQFKVTWTGPNGPGDYVTMVKPDAVRWTTETYAYTSAGNPVTLVAPIESGPYELRYVTGTDDKTMVRRPITLSPMVITLKAPASVQHAAKFQVAWTGPDGPSDYITIAPVGSPAGTYLNYAYTRSGSPVTLTAPDTAGKYEIRYQSDRVDGTFASTPIEVK
jgi:Ca-activated chloride channel family protein